MDDAQPGRNAAHGRPYNAALKDLLGKTSEACGAERGGDLLLAEPTPFHCRLLFQATDSTSNWLSFRGAGHLCYDRLTEPDKL